MVERFARISAEIGCANDARREALQQVSRDRFFRGGAKTLKKFAKPMCRPPAEKKEEEEEEEEEERTPSQNEALLRLAFAKLHFFSQTPKSHSKA